jgi:hypothetical protein
MHDSSLVRLAACLSQINFITSLRSPAKDIAIDATTN